ncbi:MAG: lysophospholipid acyltransferase family protein [Oceanibaculum sp.]
MRLVKKMLRSAAVRAFLCRLASTYMRFASWTTRWEIVGEEHPRGHWDSGQPFLGCFWHGRMMLVAPTWPREIPVDVLISRHGDGQLISTVIGHLGMGTIEGSTSRGAVTALRGVIRKLRSGRIVAITPDGPRGPRMRAAGGLALAAAAARVPVIPVSAAMSRCRILGSWDRFILPLPFGRGVIVWGAPVLLPTETDHDTIEAGRLAIETALNRLSEEADRRMGHSPIQPAPPAPETKITP